MSDWWALVWLAPVMFVAGYVWASMMTGGSLRHRLLLMEYQDMMNEELSDPVQLVRYAYCLQGWERAADVREHLAGCEKNPG